MSVGSTSSILNLFVPRSTQPLPPAAGTPSARSPNTFVPGSWTPNYGTTFNPAYPSTPSTPAGSDLINFVTVSELLGRALANPASSPQYNALINQAVASAKSRGSTANIDALMEISPAQMTIAQLGQLIAASADDGRQYIAAARNFVQAGGAPGGTTPPPGGTGGPTDPKAMEAFIKSLQAFSDKVYDAVDWGASLGIAIGPPGGVAGSVVVSPDPPNEAYIPFSQRGNMPPTSGSFSVWVNVPKYSNDPTQSPGSQWVCVGDMTAQALSNSANATQLAQQAAQFGNSRSA